MTVTFTIGKKKIKAQEHQSVLDVAQQNSIAIPTLCYHKHLSIDGSCRLCNVAVNGMNGFQMACALQVSDGMDVRTNTPDLLFRTRGVTLSDQTRIS
jgi:NADH dehydrogenase/NADH:ubiquinone oxidoreductase subunit G